MSGNRAVDRRPGQRMSGLLALVALLLVAPPARTEAPATTSSVAQTSDALDAHNRFATMDGKLLYESICQGCHMADAAGATGAGSYPALAKNPKLQNPVFAEIVVLNGLRSMPRFSEELNDQQIAAVVNYVTTHFGNYSTGLVTAADIRARRTSP